MVNLLDNPSIAAQPTTLVAMLQRRAVQQPERLAFTFLADGETQQSNLTYGELDRRARAIAAHLQTFAAAGERAVLLYPTGLDYVAAFYGCLYAGVIAAPAYPPDPMQLEKSLAGLHGVIRDAQARWVLTTTGVHALVHSQPAGGEARQPLQWLCTDQLPETPAEPWRPPQVESASIALLQYTSGSTAAPKGVMLTHANVLHNQKLIQTACHHTEQSTWVTWLPLHHNLALMSAVVQPVYVGYLSVLMPPAAFLQRPLRWLRAISRYRGRGAAGPNFGFNLCIKEIPPEQRGELDLSSWEVAIIGGEPIQCDLLERFSAAFAPCGFRPETFVPGYGLAESVLMVSVGRKSERPKVKALDKAHLGAGRAVDAPPGQAEAIKVAGFELYDQDPTIAVVHPETRRRCQPGEIGEIWVAGGSVASGYWQKPDISQATFAARIADCAEGPFLRTGDLGFIADGHFFLTGRCKELIIISGRNHYPQDIELTVQTSHPALRPNSSAAFSIASDGEERLVVAAELADDDPVPVSAAKSIVSAVQRAVAEQHGLRPTVVLLKPGTLPKTAIGKIQRLGARARYLAGTLEAWCSQ
ncbi:MAG: fatty acyl-AMP ligase [Aphanocapsa lilacina HA4352-LM1]|jgi:acyl-CoA synthetase (AMP-forming)/AMP-acid ligase II|nr:fatty acyl-AMP ligase [Aphanocapsa lilacina HA4352-LM1]